MEAQVGTQYTIGQKIGNGAFGQVYEGTWKQPSQKKPIKVAIKIVSKLLLIFVAGDSKQAKVVKHFAVRVRNTEASTG